MDINYDELWNEIRIEAEASTYVVKREYEKSLRELKEEWNISLVDTKRLANKLVEDGRLACREAKYKNGKISTVYWPVQR